VVVISSLINSSVFRSRRNVDVRWQLRSGAGREFQVDGPATAKLRGPCDDVVFSWLVAIECMCSDRGEVYCCWCISGHQRLPELAKGLQLSRGKRRVAMDAVSARLGVDVDVDKPVLLQHTASKPTTQLYCAFPRRTTPLPGNYFKTSLIH